MSAGFSRVAVVGAGLIGGSIARRLLAIGVDVTVVDPDQRTRAEAADAGLTVVAEIDDWPVDCDLVVLAGPLDSLAAVMAAVARAPGEALVVDVGSVKVAAAASAVQAGLASRYVGCHPMGGSEQSGFAHSDPGLLVGVTWAVTHPDVSAAGHVVALVRFLIAAFDAEVVVLDAAEHDRSVALVSHAPHVLANALLGLVEQADAPAARHLAAGSFRDGTRVAGRNPSRTLNMLADNSTALGGVLDDLIDLLRDYRADLERPRAGTLLARLDAVAGGATSVRRPDVVWAASDDLEGVLREAGTHPVLVRAGSQGPGGLDVATTL